MHAGPMSPSGRWPQLGRADAAPGDEAWSARTMPPGTRTSAPTIQVGVSAFRIHRFMVSSSTSGQNEVREPGIHPAARVKNRKLHVFVHD
jgi:hypothetical protein